MGNEHFSKDELLSELEKLRMENTRLREDNRRILSEKEDLEHEIEHQKNLTQYIISHAKSSIAVHDTNFKYVYVSQRYLDEYQVKEENIIGKHHYDVFPDLPEKWREVHKKALRGEVSSSTEDPYPKEDGTIEWTSWECRPWHLSNGKIGCFIINTEVVTEKLKTKEALEESYVLMNNLSALVPGVVYTYQLFPDGNSKFPYSSKGMYDIYEFTSEEVREDATPVFSRLHPDDHEHVAEAIFESARNQSFFEVEFRVVLPKQGLRCRASKARPTKLSDGSTLWYGIITDITELKNAQNLLIDKNKELEEQYEEYMQLNEVLSRTNNDLEIAKHKVEQSDKLKTAFLQNMSHEIRTPLNGIIGFTSLLQDENNTTEEIQEYIDVITQSGKRLIELVNNILDISLIETAQTTIHKEAFSLNEMMNDLFSFYIPSASAKNIELNIETPENTVEKLIFSDQLKIHQILSNLISNALKFTHKGSITYGYSIDDELIRFFVGDTGIGIPEESQEEIFNRFIQMDTSITRGYEGAGLGLSICKGLVEQLGGRIWVDSRKGVGSKFFFEVPLEYSDEVGFVSTEIAERKKSSCKKILIAEDDQASYVYLYRILKNEGNQILHAENGADAVWIVKNDPEIDLVLMDVKMPVMDGIEATKQITELRPELPIIAQTAYAFNEERSVIMKAGCKDYLSKPIDKEKLLKTLSKYLET
jgi:two-component system sensor histidine kinase/response regulator